MKQLTSQLFLNHCLETYPALRDNEAYRMFFMYLCFGTYIDWERKSLLLDAYTVAIHSGHMGIDLKHFSAGKFMKEFRDNVLPNFKWKECEVENGNARLLDCNGLSDETLIVLNDELSNRNGDDKCFFVSGKKWNKQRIAKHKKDATNDYMNELSRFELNATQRDILDYLIDVPARAFTSKLMDNKESILSTIETLDNQISKDNQYRILSNVAEDAKVNYLPSRGGHTARLFPSSSSVAGLKKEVRKAFCKGWIDLDMKSSQFCILANLLDAPIAKAFVISGQSIWKYLCNDIFGIEYDANLKPLLKELLYGIAFGSGETKLKATMTKLGVNPELFFQNDMMQELLAKRKVWYKEISENGLTDCFGNKHVVVYSKNAKIKRTPNQVAATYIQALELDIIAPVFDIARKHAKSCQIQLFQFDGITISIWDRAKRESIIGQMNQAVIKKATEYGIQGMLLEAEEL